MGEIGWKTFELLSWYCVLVFGIELEEPHWLNELIEMFELSNEEVLVYKFIPCYKLT